MKFIAVFGLVAFFVGTAVAVNVPPVFERLAECTPSPNCNCKGYAGAEFCGSQLGCGPPDNVFQCNGNTGVTCDHGFRESCKRCGQLSC